MISKEYKELFQLIARNGALNGEKAIEVILKENKDADIKDTLAMTEKFRELEDRIGNDEEINQLDYVYLYTAGVISREILNKNINVWASIVHEYDVNLLPRLLEVAKETDHDKQVELIENFFSKKVDENEN